MKNLLKTTAIIVVILSPFYANAENSGMYIKGIGGLSLLNSSKNKGSVLNIDSDYKSGYAIGGAIGKKINQNIKVEAEISYKDNDADSLTITNSGQLNGLSAKASGDVSALSFMANAYLDAKNIGIFTENNPFSPYIMGGVGYAKLDADVNSGGVKIVNDSATAFAYQVGAGINYEINKNVTVDVGYRYFATNEVSMKDSINEPFKTQYKNNLILASVSYSF